MGNAKRIGVLTARRLAPDGRRPARPRWRPSADTASVDRFPRRRARLGREPVLQLGPEALSGNPHHWRHHPRHQPRPSAPHAHGRRGRRRNPHHPRMSSSRPISTAWMLVAAPRRTLPVPEAGIRSSPAQNHRPRRRPHRTFGFSTADARDRRRRRRPAAPPPTSHHRVILAEIMGHKSRLRPNRPGASIAAGGRMS